MKDSPCHPIVNPSSTGPVIYPDLTKSSSGLSTPRISNSAYPISASLFVLRVDDVPLASTPMLPSIMLTSSSPLCQTKLSILKSETVRPVVVNVLVNLSNTLGSTSGVSPSGRSMPVSDTVMSVFASAEMLGMGMSIVVSLPSRVMVSSLSPIVLVFTTPLSVYFISTPVNTAFSPSGSLNQSSILFVLPSITPPVLPNTVQSVIGS